MDSTAPATGLVRTSRSSCLTRGRLDWASESAKKVGRRYWQANKEAFVDGFVKRPAFHAAYDGMDNSQFVDTLISHTGVSFTAAERDALVSGLGTGTMTRAEVLRSIAENGRFVSAKFNETFVMMEYFGYLRRDPDAEWLRVLAEQAERVQRQLRTGGDGQGVHRLR